MTAISIDSSLLIPLMLVTAFLVYGLLRAAEWGFITISRRGKARVIWWDGDSRSLNMTFEQIVDGNKIKRGSGDKTRDYTLEAAARGSGDYPTWVLHPRHGWNFVPLTDDETINHDRVLQAFAISNPSTAHNNLSRNKARDTLNANDPEDNWGWVKPVAIACVIGLGLVLVFSGAGLYIAMHHGG